MATTAQAEAGILVQCETIMHMICSCQQGQNKHGVKVSEAIR